MTYKGEALDAKYEYGGLDLTRLHLNGMSKRALLTAEEEVELAKKIEVGLYAEQLLEAAHILAGGQDHPLADQWNDKSLEDKQYLSDLAKEGQAAKNHMIEANLRLVVSTARRYTGYGLDYQDVMQEGSVGLIRAVEKFDYTKGFKFSTYAVDWIRQSILRGLADKGRMIRLPVHAAEKLNKLSRIKYEMSTELGRELTAGELAAVSGMEVTAVENLLEWSRMPVSFDMAVGDEDDASLGDFIADVEAEDEAQKRIELANMSNDVKRTMSVLSDLEKQVITLHFGFNDGYELAYPEIAVRLGIGKERARWIGNKALGKLRTHASGELKVYLD